MGEVEKEVKKEVMERYPRTWFVEYALLTEEKVALCVCVPDESYDNLCYLYDRDQTFFNDLVKDESLRQRFVQGNNDQSEQESENFKTIVAALENRATFARHQLSRIIACAEMLIFDKNEAQRVARDSYQELLQSMNLFEAWGTPTAEELHDDLLANYEEARDLLKQVGVD
jgi:hypothetical protein